MVKIESQEVWRLKNYKWNAPRYYDYPDGEDLLGKLSYTTKVSLIGGSFLGVCDALGSRPPAVGYLEKCIKLLGKVVPCVGMAVAFTVTTYFATNIRKKDDQINYVLGSMAAGGVLGAYVGARNALVGTLFITAVAASKKSAQMQGVEMFPNILRKTFGPYEARAYDFRLPKEEIKGNWSKELPPN